MQLAVHSLSLCIHLLLSLQLHRSSFAREGLHLEQEALPLAITRPARLGRATYMPTTRNRAAGPQAHVTGI